MKLIIFDHRIFIKNCKFIEVLNKTAKPAKTKNVKSEK